MLSIYCGVLLIVYLLRSPSKAPPAVSVWQNQAISDLQLRRVVSPEARLFRVIAHVSMAVFCFLFGRFPSVRNLLHVGSLLAGTEDAVRAAGDGIAIMFVFFGLQALYYFVFPPKIITLTEAQRKLLGIPSGDYTSTNPLATSVAAAPLDAPTSTAPAAVMPEMAPYSPAAAAVSPATLLPPRLGSAPGSPMPGSPLARLSSASSSPAQNRGSPSSVLRGLQQQSGLAPRSDIRDSTLDAADERALERLLESTARETQLRMMAESTAAPALSPLGLPTPAPQLLKYRTAPKPPPRTTPSGNKAFLEQPYLYNQAAQEVLERYGIEGQVEEWVERMRIWLSANVVKPLALQLQQLEAAGISLTQPLVLPSAAASPAPSSTFAPTTGGAGGWYGLGQPQQSSLLADFNKQPAMSEAMQQRLQAESYLQVLGTTSREYLIQRIKELSVGELMPDFRWNSGGVWKRKEWSPDLPTDSQIVLHLFCTFMDFVLPRDLQAPDAARPFTSRYVLITPDTPTKPTLADVCVYQLHVHPPHFETVYKKASEPVQQGRSNLFTALVLFLHLVQTKLDGHLGNVYLGSSSLRLMQVVQRRELLLPKAVPGSPLRR